MESTDRLLSKSIDNAFSKQSNLSGVLICDSNGLLISGKD